jgi:hypothetical protein
LKRPLKKLDASTDADAIKTIQGEIDRLKASVVNTGSATWYVVGATVAADTGFTYTVQDAAGEDVACVIKNSSVADTSNKTIGKITTDYTKKNPTEFDASNITVTATDGTVIPASALTYSVKDTEDEEVGLEGLTKKGTYTVTVSIDPSKCEYKYAGSSNPLTVEVNYATVAEAKAVISVGGKVVSGTTASLNQVEYTGSALEVATDLRLDDGTKVDPSKYTVVIKNKKGETVTEVKDLGEYTVTITSDTYTLNSTDSDKLEVAFEVVEANVKPVYVVGEASYDRNKTANGVNDAQTVYYTGSDITLDVQFDANGGVETKPVALTSLPADSYKVTITEYYDADGTKATKAPTAIKEVGKYTVTIKDANSKDNYSVGDATFYITVEKKQTLTFKDVPSTAWYADAVAQAVDAGYITGWTSNGNDFFGPEDSIKRGDVALILARMAGVLESDEVLSSSFTDVPADAYYAQAIAWAQRAGIVTGTSATTFEPERYVTRQEFATMLNRYEQKVAEGKGAAASAAATLAKYADGTAVADYATNAVAWAAEQGIMGVNTTALDPTSNVQRAQVVAMIVRYQPEAL